jgi:hypothetical protein
MIRSNRTLALLAASLVYALALGAPSFAASAQARLTPDQATPGATVSIAGKGFGSFKSSQLNRVTFNGLAALVQRWDPELIEVKVPFRAASGPVQVVIGKKTLSAGTFTVVLPSINSIAPTEAEPGTLVRISGEHFGNTAGPRDPNSMFGVNDVLVGGVPVRARRWKDTGIEVEVPANAVSGDVVVRLASSDPLPDGSCCAPVERTLSNPVSFKVVPSVRLDPVSGPVGTKVVLFGQGFGQQQGGDGAVLIGGRPATVAQWRDNLIVVHVPLDAETGPVMLRRDGKDRTVGTFTVHVSKASGISPSSGPIGTLLKITGEHFGFYSEGGETPFAFTDFNKGENRVEIGGVPAVIYRWHDDRIDVWVPYSAKSGPVVVKRGGTKPKPDGSCCAEQAIISTEAGAFTVVTPRIDSYSPISAGLDETVTIKGSGFGAFLKTTEPTQGGMTERIYGREETEFGENVSRTEVLFNSLAAVVLSWSDTEIKVRVPRRHIFGVGKKGDFFPDVTIGPLIVRRGSWDLLPDGSCCTPKKWLTLEAGQFTIEAKGLPNQSYFDDTRPDANTNQ